MDIKINKKSLISPKERKINLKKTKKKLNIRVNIKMISTNITTINNSSWNRNFSQNLYNIKNIQRSLLCIFITIFILI